MPGKVIAKHMNLGYAGRISRDADVLVFNRPVDPLSADIPFGAPVILGADNTYVLFGTTGTDVEFAGVAVAGFKQATSYTPVEGTPVVYKAEEPCDVLARGSATVICSKGTPTAGGKVYVRILENALYPLAMIGDWEAETDITPEVPAIVGTGTVEAPEFPAIPEVISTVEITSAKWTTGYKDINNVAEVTLSERNNP